MSLYTIGGGNAGNENNRGIRYKDVNVYKLHNGEITWDRRGTDAPKGQSDAMTVTHGKDIFMVGGNSYNEYEVYKYNTETSTWQAMKNLKKGRGSSPATFILSDRLYTAGGDDGYGGFHKTMESIDLTDPTSDWQIENVGIPYTIVDSKAVTVAGRAYIFGGAGYTFGGNQGGAREEAHFRRAISWSPGETNWTSLASMNIGRTGRCTVTDGEDTIWLVGGQYQGVPKYTKF